MSFLYSILFVFAVLVLVGLAIWLTRVRLNRKIPKPEGDQKLIFPSLCVCYSFVGIVAILFAEVDVSNRALFATIFGLIISSLLAISSSSFVANAMAGFLVNRAENFGDGD